MGKPSSRNIVFINQSTGYLMKDIINKFATSWDKTVLIAGSISENGVPLNKVVRILKIVKYEKSSIFHRKLSWVFATIQTIWLVMSRFRGYHLFITSNPPTLAFLPFFCRNRYSVLIYDIYPDGLIAGGFVNRSSLLYRIWYKANIRYFKNASNIYTLSKHMADTLSQYCERERIIVIPPWYSSDLVQVNEKTNNIFIETYNLSNKFIILYSGNIGAEHYIEILIEAAKILIDEKDILFVIAGDGIKKRKITELVKESDLFNCLILPFQPTRIFLDALTSANLGVVAISKRASNVCLPSKTFNLLTLGIPIICLADKGSELAEITFKEKIGEVFGEREENKLAEFILKMKNDIPNYSSYKANVLKCSLSYTPVNAELFLKTFKD